MDQEQLTKHQETQTELAKEARDAFDIEGEPILKYFAYAHLPEFLQVVSKPFGELALQLYATLKRSPERTVAFRKLLESKDAAVRAALP